MQLQRTTDTNFLSPTGFKFKLLKLPNIEYFCQKFNFPGMSIPQPGIMTPFSKLTVPGDHVRYDTFGITFKVDEGLYSYFEISDWITGTGFPDSFDQYANLASQNAFGTGVISDASVTFLTNTMEPNVRVDFTDVSPESLSGFEMNVTDEGISYVTARATFTFRGWSYTRII